MPPLIEQVSLLKQRNLNDMIDENNIFDSLTLDSNYD